MGCVAGFSLTKTTDLASRKKNLSRSIDDIFTTVVAKFYHVQEGAQHKWAEFPQHGNCVEKCSSPTARGKRDDTQDGMCTVYDSVRHYRIDTHSTGRMHAVCYRGSRYARTFAPLQTHWKPGWSPWSKRPWTLDGCGAESSWDSNLHRCL
jgi:hypothetical protein